MKEIIKEYFKQPVTIWGLVFTFIFGCIYFTNEYLSYKPVTCTVLDKLESSGRRRGEFYLVLKEGDYVFDLIVSPATYSQAQMGENLTFQLREFDYKQSLWNNTIYFFGAIIFGVLAVVTMMCSLTYKSFS